MRQIIIDGTTININPSRVISISTNPDITPKSWRVICNDGVHIDTSDEGFISGLIDDINNLGDGSAFGSYASITQDTSYLYISDYSTLDYKFARKNLSNDSYDGELGRGDSISLGNWFGHNTITKYDDTVEFVVKTPRNGRRISATADDVDGYRYKTIGTAHVKGLGKDDAVNRKGGSLYKLVPFLLTDGINEYGLACSVSEVPAGDRGHTTGTVPAVELKDEIPMIMLVRYILDNFTSASTACQWIKDYVKVYTDESHEYHFFLTDETESVILEFVNNEVVYEVLGTDHPSYATDFYIHDTVLEGKRIERTSTGMTPYGCGLERYNVIGENFSGLDTKSTMIDLLCTSLDYTTLYTTHNWDGSDDWRSEYVGNWPEAGKPWPDLTNSSSKYDFEGIAKYYENIFVNRTRTDEDPTRFTMSTAVYDIKNRTLSIVHQGRSAGTCELFMLTDSEDMIEIIQEIINGKQDKLISGENIKTIYGESILGTGDMRPMNEWD